MTQTPPKGTFGNSNNFNNSQVEERTLATDDQQSEQRWTIAETQSKTPLGRFELRRFFTSLQGKATAVAIAIGTVPVLMIGTVAYNLAEQSIAKEIYQTKQSTTTRLQQDVSRFMRERYGDIQVLAALRVLTDPNVRNLISVEQKQEQLNSFLEVSKVYDLISVVDLKGNVLLQTKGDRIPNQSQRQYFQAVLKTDRPVIGDAILPAVSSNPERLVLQFAAPIKDSVTGKTIAIIRARVPVEKMDELLASYAQQGDQYYLIDRSKDQIFLAKDTKQENKKVDAVLPKLTQLRAAGKLDTALGIDIRDQQENLLTYTGFDKLEGLPELSWEAVLTTPTEVAFQAKRVLLLTMTIGTLVTAVVVAAIAAFIANRAVRPILAATSAVEKIGQGELDTRVEVKGEDELAVLGANINQMVQQLENLLLEQAFTAQQSRELEVTEKIAQEQRQLKEGLQKRALELLMEVDPISKGDLTIRAKVTADEIGTIADSYNATVGNLRKIVSKVQEAASQVTATTSSNEASVQALSAEALHQAEEIAVALSAANEMAQSVQLVASNTQLAEAAVRQAQETVQEGDLAMNRTVEGILAIRDTVAETAKKVKHLGESSQKISTVVNLISSFAAQTNLLALNASIEAARAGEEGRGFAVVADEVRSLARQSAEATSEIEKLVAAIQSETNEVVAAMEAGTEQVVTGTRLVDETRFSLNKITTASKKISEVVEAIAQATVVQSMASEAVTQTMTNVAASAQKTSKETSAVSSSFEELLKVAKGLQEDVGKFKVS
ncbi:MAG: methyl-accepting chemotaxis protein [Potamolinea sp.]